ncbi:hypothetical protein Bbelb_357950 [Branchiostoma belcheri]|nr:hypothetical protein Bbelb_357950 [Branchiostoma belcheri]
MLLARIGNRLAELVTGNNPASLILSSSHPKICLEIVKDTQRKPEHIFAVGSGCVSSPGTPLDNSLDNSWITTVEVSRSPAANGHSSGQWILLCHRRICLEITICTPGSPTPGVPGDRSLLGHCYALSSQPVRFNPRPSEDPSYLHPCPMRFPQTDPPTPAVPVTDLSRDTTPITLSAPNLYALTPDPLSIDSYYALSSQPVRFNPRPPEDPPTAPCPMSF